MKKSILKFENFISNDYTNTYRTIIKTQHSRLVFLALSIDGDTCTIRECFYTDRNQGKSGMTRYASKPLKLKTFQFHMNLLLSVIETELDKKFYDVEFIQSDNAKLPLDQYLQLKSESAHKKYRFLIMVGNGDNFRELPMHLRTRLKNKLHRSIFVELSYYKNGQGVVEQCHYYDREYKRKNIKITPSLLTSCFFPYNCEGILNLLNHEICCDFTHMIVTTGIDIDSNKMPLCGAL